MMVCEGGCWSFLTTSWRKNRDDSSTNPGRLPQVADSPKDADAAVWEELRRLHGGGVQVEPPRTGSTVMGRTSSRARALFDAKRRLPKTKLLNPVITGDTGSLARLGGSNVGFYTRMIKYSPIAARCAQAARRATRAFAMAGVRMLPTAALPLRALPPRAQTPTIRQSKSSASVAPTTPLLRKSSTWPSEETTPDATSPSSISSESHHKPYIVDGFLVSMPEDGSCLFHSIAFGLGDSTDGPTLRRQVAQVIENEPTLKIANTTVREWVRMAAGKDHSVHAKELYRGECWGGAVELAVAAKIRQVNIHVYEAFSDGFRCITAFDVPGAVRSISVVYHTEPCRHYDALVITKGGP